MRPMSAGADASVTPTGTQGWVGRPLQRVEDGALLRGQGRFLDDLSPVPGAYHAAIVRSQLAHARIALDPSAALAHPGVIGVLTGDDVRELSRPFPAGIDTGVPQYAAAVGRRPLRRRAARRGRRPGPLRGGGRSRARGGRLRPARPGRRPAARVWPACVHDRSFHYGDVDAALAAADLVVRERFRFPRFSCTPVECYAVVADWDPSLEQLTAWSNFQGPFTLHGVAAAALGLRGNQLRLITPSDSGGSFGIKSSVFAYVVLLGLAARKLGVPVRWTEDRIEHLTGSAAATGRVTDVEAGFTADGELIALRYDAVEDVGAYVRAPEPATLYRMHGSLSGAYRVRNVAVRNRVVLTNTLPSGLNRGFGGPQLYFGLERTMAIAARHGWDSTRPSSRAGTSSRLRRCRTRPRRVGSTTPATTRHASTRRSSSPATTSAGPRRAGAGGAVASSGSASPASSSRRSRTWATSPSRRRPTSARQAPRSPATPRARRSRSTRLGGINVQVGTRRRGRATARCAPRSSRTRSAAIRRRSR